MKIKNINIAERHVEKAILGLCLLASLYFLYTYAIGGSYGVTVNNEQKSPTELEATIKSAAQRLQSEVESDKVHPALQTLEVAPYAQNFIERWDRPILAEVYNYPFGPGRPALEESLIGPGMTPQMRTFALTVPPEPTGIIAREDFSLLMVPPDAPERDDLIKLVGDEVPLDFRYVSVQAQFNMAEWRAEQIREPADVRVPADWTRDSSFIVDVILERQTWDPLKGAWGPIETIVPVPGNLSFRNVGNPLGKQQADQWIEEIRLQQDLLSKPPFAPVAPIRPWLPPDVIGQLTPDQVMRLREIEAEKAQIRMQLDGVAPVQPGAGAPQAAGFGDAGAAFNEADLSPSARRSVGIGRAPASASSPAAAAPSNADLVKRFQDLHAEYLQLIGAQGREQAFDPRNFQAADVIKVWQHDLTAEPGMTYQYRIVVGVINPLFQRNTLGNEQRRTQKDVLVRRSRPSAWSQPVTIPADRQFFVASQDLGGSKAASIEIWSIFEGAWRKSMFSVQPGDPIGGQTTITGSSMAKEVDLNVNATVVDVDLDFPVASQPNAKTTRVLYMDDTTGELYWQTAFEDAKPEARRAVQAN